MIDLNATVPKKAGRPAKDIEFEDLPLRERILLLYSEGRLDSAVCNEIQMSKEEFADLIKEDEAFSRLVSFGRTVCQAWWEEKYRLAATGEKNPNGSMVNFAMKNLFGWAEKTETTNSDQLMIEGLSRDEALEQIRKLLPNIVDIAEARERKKA